LLFWYHTKSVVQVQRCYSRHFGIQLHHYEKLHKSHSGQKKTGHSEGNVEMARQKRFVKWFRSSICLRYVLKPVGETTWSRWESSGSSRMGQCPMQPG
jgi:hypothetical protein